MSEWQPIETYPKQAFDAETWYRSGERRLFCTPQGWVQIGYYGYTQRGRGRFIDANLRVFSPTHWMDLPAPPIKNPASALPPG